MYKLIIALSMALVPAKLLRAQPDTGFLLIQPDRVFDGTKMHSDWVVLVQGDSIVQAGPMRFKLPAGSRILRLAGATLMPGMIEGHSHLFLHPYNENSWDNQVLKESRAERTARAVQHAAAMLHAGFTSTRDLGTEGAGYDDIGLKQAIEKGIIPGPRMLVATRAIVATGTYGPRSANPDIEFIHGAAEVANLGEMEKEVRLQLSKGADLIKLYADYRWGLNKITAPEFSVDELRAAVRIAGDGGRPVVAHASSREGMRRAIEAGVATIEHGDMGNEALFLLMKEKNIALCPTLAAAESVARYNGWRKGIDPSPDRVKIKKESFRQALKSGVRICMGGDAGVYAHGNNALELELMVEYGMPNLEVLKAATSGNAELFGWGSLLGSVRRGWKADLIAVEGDPLANISAVRNVILVIKNGIVYKTPEARP